MLYGTDAKVISSETPATPYFVESRNEVPLRSELKPAVKVLSRKPTPTVIARKDPVSGIEKLVIEDEGDDEEHEENKAKASTAEERQLKAQKEREEKLKKYDQVRERLFGTPTPSASVEKIEPSTPPRIKSPGERGRGRGKGSGLMETRAGNSALGKAGKQLYDPNHVPKPDSAYLQKKEAQESGRSTPVENQIIRKPRGPDQSGRGGFGFTNRGNRKAPQGVELSGQ